ncbi:hypothetical protein BASA62_002881 [Batrachochytrium salamandrivorans]|nr:hypothetical protein BASA62_002881 [Batrachochytrium salamandrivorans]
MFGLPQSIDAILHNGDTDVNSSAVVGNCLDGNSVHLLSKKTQRLVQAASAISNTLVTLECGLLAQSARRIPLQDIVSSGVPSQAPYCTLATEAISSSAPVSLTKVEETGILNLVTKEPPSHISATTMHNPPSILSNAPHTLPSELLLQKQPAEKLDRVAQTEPLEQENQESRLRFDTMSLNKKCYSQSLSPSKVHFQQYPQKQRSPQDNYDNLRNRIALLEADLDRTIHQKNDAQAQSIAMTAKYESIQARNHNLQMKISFQDREMKALSEQNEMMRRASQRARETEAALQSQIIKLVSETQTATTIHQTPLNTKPAPVSTVASTPGIDPTHVLQMDDSTKNCLLKMIDERMRWVSSTRDKYQSSDVTDRAGVIDALRQLDTVMATFHGIQRIVQCIKNTTDVNQAYLFCTQVVEGISAISKGVCATLEESQLIDQRISRLFEESTQIRKRAEHTIHDMTVQFQVSHTAMRHEMDLLGNRLNATIAERDSLRETNTNLTNSTSSVVSSNTELRKLNKNLLKKCTERDSTKPVPEPTPTPVNVAVPVPVFVKMEDLQTHSDQMEQNYCPPPIHELNQSLKSHVEYLEKTITDWREENESLRLLLQQSETMVKSKDAESTQYMQQIMDLQTGIEDERLKTKKAVELVKSIKHDKNGTQEYDPCDTEREHHRDLPHGLQYDGLGHGPPTTTVELERVFDEHVAKFKKPSTRLNEMSSAGQSEIYTMLEKALVGEAGACNGFGADALFKLVRDSETSSAQLADLGHAIEDAVSKSKILTDENQNLKDRIRADRTKMRSRESAWLEKIKSLRQDYTKCVDDCRQLDEVLADYEKQFSSILIFSSKMNAANTDPPGAGHPYPFATLFAHLDSVYVSVTHHAESLHQRVNELQECVSSKETQLQAQTTATETISIKGQEQTSKIHDLQRQGELHAHKLEQLKQDLEQSEDARKKAESKLKKVVTAYKTFMGDASLAA